MPLTRYRCACGEQATKVTNETLSTLYCDACYEKRKRPGLDCISLFDWVTKVCPPWPHAPHVGCWHPTVLCSGHFGQGALCSGHFPPAQPPQQHTKEPEKFCGVWKVIPGLI